MSGLRGFAAAQVASGLAGLLVVIAAGRRWAAATVSGATGSPQHVHVSGNDVAPGLAACGWAIVVLTLVVMASRGRLRRGAGGGILVAGLIAVAVVATQVGDVDTKLAAKTFGAAVRSVPAGADAWPWFAAAGGVVAMAAGAASIRYARSWPELSRRYDAPGTHQAPSDDDASRWAALDRGEDPTA